MITTDSRGGVTVKNCELCALTIFVSGFVLGVALMAVIIIGMIRG